jgi:hypothetical protein
LLYGVSGTNKKDISPSKSISRHAPSSRRLTNIPVYNPRLASGMSLYY